MTSRHVLVVDGDADCRRAIAQALAPRRFAVAEAHSGASALELVRWRRFELFVIDAQMAPLGGRELIARLRALGHDAPVVLVSALDAAALGAAQADREVPHVRKPIDAAALRAAVTAALASGPA